MERGGAASLDIAGTPAPTSARTRWRARGSEPWRAYSHRAQISTSRKGGSASRLDIGLDETRDLASGTTPGPEAMRHAAEPSGLTSLEDSGTIRPHVAPLPSRLRRLQLSRMTALRPHRSAALEYGSVVKL